MHTRVPKLGPPVAYRALILGAARKCPEVREVTADINMKVNVRVIILQSWAADAS